MNAKDPAARAKTLLETAKSRIDYCLEDWLRRAKSDFASNNGEEIVAEVGRSAIGRGARLRPLLCCCGYAIGGGEGGLLDDRIVRVAASLELLHTFAILHDDVMDGSEMRRGEPSLFRRVASERSDLDPGEAERLGLSVAILAGDLALVLSDELFMRSGFAAQRLLQAWTPLSSMRLAAVAGQYLDLTHSGPLGTDADPDLAIRIARLKSASYSVEGPLLVGATLGLATPEAVEALTEFAAPLGEAFQLTDDLLGLFGDPAETGKDADNDVRRGKPTPLISTTLSMATQGQRKTLLSAWGNPAATDRQIDHLREVVVEAGALEAMGRQIDGAVAAAARALDNAESRDLEPEMAGLLLALAEEIRRRATRALTSALSGDAPAQR